MDKYGPKAAKVPLVDFQIDRMEELKKQILAKQAEAEQLPAAAAFVTLRYAREVAANEHVHCSCRVVNNTCMHKCIVQHPPHGQRLCPICAHINTHSTRVQQTLCANALVHHDSYAWLPHPAPAPEEVLWANLGFRKWERSVRKGLIMAAYIALLLFMIIPITLLQGLISAVSNVSWLSFMYTISPLNAVMTSVVPTLALKIFIIILPPLLKLMTRLEGVTSVTEVDLGMETKYYGYLVRAFVLLVVLILY